MSKKKPVASEKKYGKKLPPWQEKILDKLDEPKPYQGVTMQLHQPLYDTEWVSPGFLFKQNLLLFQRPIGQCNMLGETKTYADTNMTQCSQIGRPQSHRVTGGIVTEIIGGCEPDRKTLLKRGVFVFNLGQGRAWIRAPLSWAVRGALSLPEGQELIESGDTFQVEVSWPYTESGDSLIPGTPKRGDDDRALDYAIRSRIGVRVYLVGELKTSV